MLKSISVTRNPIKTLTLNTKADYSRRGHPDEAYLTGLFVGNYHCISRNVTTLHNSRRDNLEMYSTQK